MPGKMMVAFCAVFMYAACAHALAPDEILVIANANNAASVRLARYYCQKRGVPAGRVVPVALGTQLRDSMSRSDYEQRLARPIRRIFATRDDMRGIKCLVTTYGIPFKVGRRGPQVGSDRRLKNLRRQLQQEKEAIAQEEERKQAGSAEHTLRRRKAMQLQMDIDCITGAETSASVDSELSLVLFGAYELYRWRPNLLRDAAPQPFKTLMVCRLDGPDYGIAKGLVDKAIMGETNGLAGTAYIDSRGMFQKDAYGFYDQSLRDLALLTQLKTSLPVKEERTGALFDPNSCPQAALHCGWYSLKRYVDAFDFVPGAIGFHIASYEAVNLRDAKSTQWCPALLKKGITATLGPVAEPYLHAFPQPRAFFGELFEGRCLVEAFYRTKPFNSWQLVLIGDPLYRPFGQE